MILSLLQAWLLGLKLRSRTNCLPVVSILGFRVVGLEWFYYRCGDKNLWGWQVWEEDCFWSFGERSNLWDDDSLRYGHPTGLGLGFWKLGILGGGRWWLGMQNGGCGRSKRHSFDWESSGKADRQGSRLHPNCTRAIWSHSAAQWDQYCVWHFCLLFCVCFQVHSFHLGISSCVASYGAEWEDENVWALAKQVHKELQETMAQLEAIRHEMRTGLSILNPGPMTRQVMDSAAPGLLNPVEIKETGDCAVVWDTAHLFSVFFTLQLLPCTKVTFIVFLFYPYAS